MIAGAAPRGMLRRRAGSIVALSSVVGVQGNAGQANYAASKAGIIGLVKALAREAGPRGVRVNAVAPGFIRTRLTDVLADAHTEGLLSRHGAGAPGRPGGRRGARRVPVLARVAAFITGTVHGRGRRASDMSERAPRRGDGAGDGVAARHRVARRRGTAALAGTSTAGEITRFDASEHACRIACEVPGLRARATTSRSARCAAWTA